jgi:hypothetical protein
MGAVMPRSSGGRLHPLLAFNFNNRSKLRKLQPNSKKVGEKKRDHRYRPAV